MFDYILSKLNKYLNKTETGMVISNPTTASDPLHVRIAKRYHGWREKEENNELKKLLGFNPVTTAWCAGFVNAVEKMTGRKGTGKLLAREYLKYGAPTSKPKLGDIVVFKRGNSSWQGHVGYYVSEDKNGVLSLGGNQGDKVCFRYYPKKDVLGYRRPL
jgi:uncharacterized protein (TIGR02594 family)